MDDEDKLARALYEALRREHECCLNDVCEHVDRYIIDVGFFPELIFSSVLSIMVTDSYLNREDSVSIIKLFEYSLSMLTDAQKSALFDKLEYIEPLLLDETSVFLTVELLAEIYADNRSLEALLRLKRRAKDIQLALVAHGFEWLSKRTSDTTIRQRCLDEILDMTRHQSPLVSREAIDALKRRRS